VSRYVCVLCNVYHLYIDSCNITSVIIQASTWLWYVSLPWLCLTFKNAISFDIKIWYLSCESDAAWRRILEGVLLLMNDNFNKNAIAVSTPVLSYIPNELHKTIFSCLKCDMSMIPNVSPDWFHMYAPQMASYELFS
jgi:hypothetical protein